MVREGMGANDHQPNLSDEEQAVCGEDVLSGSPCITAGLMGTRFALELCFS